MSSQCLRFLWIKEWAENFWAALTAIWRFTRSLIIEEKKETGQQNCGWCRVQKKFFRHYSFTLLLFLILWALDPVGVASNSARASAELFYRVISPLYPPPTQEAKRGSDEPLDDDTEIAVIVINDATLKRKGKPWPPPFATHAEVIERILLYGPKALFIDFGFFDERDKDDLEILAATLKWRPTQLARTETACAGLLRKPVGCHPDDKKVIRKVPTFLAGAPEGLEVIGTLKHAVTGTVSTRYSTEHELPYNSYLLYDCDTKEPSAALALYAAYHDDWIKWGLFECPKNWLREGGPNKLSVYWASWGDALNSRGSYECRTLPTSLLGRAFQVVWIWFLDRLQQDRPWREQFQTCPPHRSLAAHVFLADESARLAEFIEDRYVFYGGNFAMADDLITPPTHEPVPGVFLHAMAFDNLLRFGAGYINVEDDSGFPTKTFLLTFLAAMFMVLCSVIAWDGFEKVTKRPKCEAPKNSALKPDPCWSPGERIWDTLRPFGSYAIGISWVAVWFSISCGVILFGLWVGFSVLNFAPINYIGLLAFLGLDTIARSVHHLLAGVLS